MLKKLMLTLFLALVMSGAAAPIMKSFIGIGSTAAYAQGDQGENDDTQDDDDFDGDEQ